MHSLRFHPAHGSRLGILVYVKHRAPPPLIIICGRLRRPISDIFKTTQVEVKQAAFQGGFFVYPAPVLSTSDEVNQRKAKPYRSIYIEVDKSRLELVRGWQGKVFSSQHMSPK